MSTYTPIASITLASAASSVTFSGIPQTYTDLVLVAQVKTTTYNGVDINVDVNGDTGSNYSTTSVRGNGSTASSARTTSGTYFSVDNLSIMNTSDWSITRLNFQNYSNAVTNKTVLARTDRAGAGTSATVNLWRSTSAVTSIRFTCGADQYASGSTFNLYGINAANSGQAKATGGDSIYRDASYWYHVFNKSGTFTPAQNLSNVDYLVVAGGGGGGGNDGNVDRMGGGGGAGGLRSTVTVTGGGGSLESALSLTSGTNYTVTIGAGGAGGLVVGNNVVGANGSNGTNSSISGTDITIVTSTGGGGGGQSRGATGNTGGSGGGGGDNGNDNGGAGTTNQGYAGGTGSGGVGFGGGGGGAGGAGTSANASGTGGNGVAISISGSSATYAVGGTAGQGTRTNGTANTGNGGSGSRGGSGAGNVGGSGIVIVRYPV